MTITKLDTKGEASNKAKKVSSLERLLLIR